MSYLLSLRSLKTLFGPSDEVLTIARVIRKALRPNDIRILDVGTADGSAARRIAGQLTTSGFRCAIVGIDVEPQLSGEEHSEHAFSYEFQQVSFQRYQDPKPFDLVLFRQSMYYLGDPKQVFVRASELTSSGGVVLAVTWDTHCALRRLVETVDPSNSALDIAPPRLLQDARFAALVNIGVEQSIGALDMGKVKANPDLYRETLELLLRGRSFTAASWDYLVSALPNLKDIEVRSNGIVAFGKSSIT